MKLNQKRNAVTIAASIFLALATGSPAQGWVDTYDGLLQKYVSGNGVKYQAWKADSADRSALKGVVKSIAAENVSGKSNDEKLAFYLNAYNAWILDQILDDYPTGGPGGGGLLGRNRFFKADSLTVAGKKISFTDLENKVIRKEFDEPRIHFALNCASTSCPPLHNRAFTAGSLDTTLDALTRNFINSNPLGVKESGAGKKVAISKIFDWYAEDFASAGGDVAYINRYRSAPLQKGVKRSFQKYDWSLNERK